MNLFSTLLFLFLFFVFSFFFFFDDSSSSHFCLFPPIHTNSVCLFLFLSLCVLWLDKVLLFVSKKNDSNFTHFSELVNFSSFFLGFSQMIRIFFFIIFVCAFLRWCLFCMCFVCGVVNASKWYAQQNHWKLHPKSSKSNEFDCDERKFIVLITKNVGDVSLYDYYLSFGCLNMMGI